jgi:hypothetical protein
MKQLIFLAISLCIVIPTCNGQTSINNPADPSYRENLNKTKAFYPFESWQNAFNVGLTQYTKSNCNQMRKIFDDLIAELIKIGKDAKEADKLSLFEKAILKINALNDKTGGALIETEEAEQLVMLTNKIAIACGIDPSKYGYGEGPASEWREW